jgi:hypothetical protein
MFTMATLVHFFHGEEMRRGGSPSLSRWAGKMNEGLREEGGTRTIPAKYEVRLFQAMGISEEIVDAWVYVVFGSAVLFDIWLFETTQYNACVCGASGHRCSQSGAGRHTQPGCRRDPAITQCHQSAQTKR